MFAGESASSLLPGDLDGDGRVTMADAVLCLRVAVGLGSPAIDDLPIRADVAPAWAEGTTGDGSVTPADAVVVLRRAVGIGNES